MSRARITAEQRIFDLFAELETPAMAGLVARLDEFRRFAEKRDGAKPKATNGQEPLKEQSK